MWWMLAGLFGAFVYGLVGKPPVTLLRFLERAVTVIVYGLIFVMGVSLGQDAGIVSRLPQLGLISFGFAVATVCGSLLAVLLVRPWLRSNDTELPAGQVTGLEPNDGGR